MGYLPDNGTLDVYKRNLIDHTILMDSVVNVKGEKVQHKEKKGAQCICIHGIGGDTC